MPVELSEFAKRFHADAAIVQLMDDLGDALTNNPVQAMLGGGNPDCIPQVQATFQGCMQRLAADAPRFATVIGDYGPPQGDPAFISALAEMLSEQYGWDIGPDNIALTAGSQSAFFILFNILGGGFSGGRHKRILLPIVPEYIGYGDVGLSDDLFVARQPRIEKYPDQMFKYHPDFDQLKISDDIGAICVSRPTNPTGNVLTNEEVAGLDELAKQHDIPLIIDNAYGIPFPNIIFRDIKMIWNENIILSMSLSKLGLPGARTGIVIARPDLISVIKGINGVINLSLGNLGPALVLDLIRNDELSQVCDTIRSWYLSKAQRTVALLHDKLAGLDYYIHQLEGALFIWLWFPELPISSRELYQRLKQRGMLILAGEPFFPGLQTDWPHSRQCIRLSYPRPDAEIEAGIDILADELRKLSS
ncbi:MAG: valine--pyruvate transaminase [Gammaproteobacteria bacterium]